MTFQNGRSETFTHIILCTGYEGSYPYLPETYSAKRLQERYKLIFDPDDPSLLFIGYARPILGSIPLMTEIQCLYAFQVLSGKLALPDSDTMRAVIRQDIENREHYFYGKRRSDNLIYPLIYGYDVAELGGVSPKYGRLLFENPLAFFKTFFSPMSAAHFLLNDPVKCQRAVAQIWSHQNAALFVFPWIYLLSRILLVDPVIHLLQKLKYIASAK
ncbi:MAG: hypothetical protein GDA56_15000 [Hormoscilla sp. GM7CHS1pb]|nr:hypothetical protein [Hormoscilla sp. GM7CHS1pb]